MTVEEAPRYIRVRSNWIEKLLLAAVLAQIILVAWLLLYGSTAAREGREETEGNRILLCARIFDVSPDQYNRYLQYCPARGT